MTEISLDIREIKTTISHFGEKFDRIQNEIAEVKIATNEAENEVETLKIKINTVEIQEEDHENLLESKITQSDISDANHSDTHACAKYNLETIQICVRIVSCTAFNVK